jgi:hypothetical protein
MPEARPASKCNDRKGIILGESSRPIHAADGNSRTNLWLDRDYCSVVGLKFS